MNNFDNFCRICLSKASIPIFDSTSDEYRDIGQKLSFCLCEKIEDIDGYPRNICEACYTTVNDIIDFQNKYKESCELLTQSLKQTLKLSCIKQEFEELSNHSFDLISDLDLGSVTSESKIVFRDAEQFKELIQPLVKNVKEKPTSRKRAIAKLAAKSEPLIPKVKKESKIRKGLKPTKKEIVQPLASNVKDNPTKRKRGIAKPTFNNSQKINFKQVNSRIYSSILEGEFHFTGEQWCLKAPNKVTEANQLSENKINKEPNMVQEDVSPTCKDVPMRKSKTNESRLCELCGSTFENITNLKSHVKRIHLKTSSKCPSCPKILSDNAALRKHIKRCHTKEFKCVCPVCGKGFISGKELNQHHKVVHLKIKRKLPCKFCDKEFSLAKCLLMHERSVHTGERPEVCSVCDARFTHEDYLKEHMRLHTGETPFKCPVCGRGYAQRCNMKSHIKHGHRISQLTETMLKTIKPNYLRLMKP